MRLIDSVREQLARLELDCPVLWEPVRPSEARLDPRAPPPGITGARRGKDELDHVANLSNN